MIEVTWPTIRKAVSVKGRTLVFRNIDIRDAEFILSLRTDEKKSRYLNSVDNEIESQKNYLKTYESAEGEAYFVIEYDGERIGTVRLYDAKNNSFCWGSWILKDCRPAHAAIESTLMVYAYAIDTLGFEAAHFDVRRGNTKVQSYHENFGARRVAKTESDDLFEIDLCAIRAAQKRFKKYLSEPLVVKV